MIELVGIAKLLDLGFTIWLAGIEREAIVNKVREMEAAGASADEVTDALQTMRKEAEQAAQDAIDLM